MTRFCHESEEFIASILDHLDIEWEYENHTFVIRTDDDGIIKRAFCPDFYLPEYDVFLEVTVMKRASKKKRKIEDTMSMYPVNIMLIGRDMLQSLEKEFKFLKKVDTADELVL